MVLPVCSVDARELDIVIDEVGRLLGEGVKIWVDRQSCSGFVRPLILGRDVSDLEIR